MPQRSPDQLSIESHLRSRGPTRNDPPAVICGLKGGKVRAERLSSLKRKALALNGVNARRSPTKAMREQELDQQELAFVRELEKHVNKWVAILNYGSDSEAIVASGATIREARQEAESKGFADAFFFKVPSGDRTFVPMTNTSAI